MQKKHLTKSSAFLFNKLIEKNFLDSIKGIYEKPTADIILNSERLDTFPLRLVTKQDAHFHHTFFHIVLESLARVIRQETPLFNLMES